MNVSWKIVIVCSIVLILIGILILSNKYIFNDDKFDYCSGSAEAKNIFEERIEYINTQLDDESKAVLKEEDTSVDGDYYFQEYVIKIDNEEIIIVMICKNNALEYNVSWKKYGEDINFIYTKEEIDIVAKILNSISKRQFNNKEIEEFVKAKETKYSVERYGFTKSKYAILEKIKYINPFTRYAAFEQTVWSYGDNEGYVSLFSINGKFSKSLKP